MFQFKRNAEDDNKRTEEKMALTINQETGHSLPTVNLLMEEIGMMQTERNSCEQRANAVMENSQKFTPGGHSNSDMNNLTELLDLLELFMLNGIDNFKHLQSKKLTLVPTFFSLKKAPYKTLPHYDLRMRQVKRIVPSLRLLVSEKLLGIHEKMDWTLQGGCSDILLGTRCRPMRDQGTYLENS